MAQIVPRDSIAERIGSGLGSGLGQTLQLLAAQKMNELAQRQQSQRSASGLQGLGYNPQEASQLALLDPAIQREIVKQKLAAPQQEAYAQALSQLLGGDSRNMTLDQAELPESSAQLQEQGQISGKSPSLAGLNQRQATDLAKIGIDLKKTQQKQTAAERKEFIQNVYPEIKNIRTKAEGARESIDVIDRMIETAKKGNPQTAWLAFSNFLEENEGINISGFLNGDTQELVKLEKFFLRNLKSIFGAHVRVSEMQNYLKSVPNSTQSPKGIERVGNLMKLQLQSDIKKQEVADQILEKYPNVKPEQFDRLLAKEMKPWQEQYSQEFRQYSRESSGSKKAPHDILKRASEFKDVEITDPETGKTLISNGTKWVPIGA